MVWALARERVDLGMRKWDEADHVSRTRGLIVAFLDREGRPPRLKEVARASGTSPRTLVRMLQTTGASFHAIVEEERRVRVLKLMSTPSLSLSEVADAAGFPDASSFGRKFRSWFGQSPARYRRAASGTA
jgi:AraC-like DNA-binding protein